MILQDNFNIHSKEYIFSDDKLLSSERQNIFDKIQSNNFEKRNNESLKNITFAEVENFNYFYEKSNNQPSIKLLDNNIYEITLIDGKSKNYEDKNIEVRNILSDDIKNNRNHIFEDPNDIISHFNTIFLNSGLLINIKENSNINLKIIHKSKKNYTIFQHNFFNFKKNCKVLLEESFDLTQNTINNIKYSIHANEGSKIKHNIFQNFSNSNKLYLTSNTICKKYSSFSQNTFNFANGFVRNYHYAKLIGEFSRAVLKGCFFLKDDNFCSNKTYINHNAENCESDQTYKGILNDNSKASYYSNTYVSETAQKTEGYQLSKGILLTDSCTFFSKPELRIFADDVKCSHGSTIGPVDESALYYLRSRGINKNQAMKMIISSFIADELKYLNKTSTERINHSLSKFLTSI